MGILGTLLLAPVRSPLTSTLWIAAKLVEAAESELNDPATIKRTLKALEAALEAGEIDEESYEREEAVLLARLVSGQRP